jgi:hypothetical protein
MRRGVALDARITRGGGDYRTAQGGVCEVFVFANGTTGYSSTSAGFRASSFSCSSRLAARHAKAGQEGLHAHHLHPQADR